MRLQKYILFYTWVIMTSIGIKAQETTQMVSGQVIGSDSLPAIGVAVIMQHIDSMYIEATTTDVKGNFTLRHPGKSYRLLFQHIAYMPYSLEASSTWLGIIKLTDNVNTLSEVTVTAKRPLIKIVEDRLTYDPISILQNKIVSNAYDLLKELPSIQNESGSLIINGAVGKTYVVVNGKASSMTDEQLQDYLKSLPAERVEKVEIVYNAPPQWHIRGAAINIVLKKSESYSFQAQVKGGWDHTGTGTDSYNGGGSIYLSNKKLSLDLLYNYGNNRWKNHTISGSLHTLHEETYDIQSDNREKWHSQKHNIYTSLNYAFANKHNLALTYNGQFNPDKNGNTYNDNNLFSNAASRNEEKSDLHNLRMVYDVPFGLSTGIEYTFYKNSRNQDMNYMTTPQDKATTFLYDRSQQIDKTNIFADMSHSLSHNWKLSYGIKYDYTNNKNKQYYNDVENNGKDSYDQTSLTKEHSARAYLNFSKSLFNQKLNISASLTGEIYKINDYKKNSLLPNATITYTPTAKHILQLSYNTLRRYPSYWLRQEYISHADEYTTYYGNPELRPDKTSYVNLVYVLNNRYIFQLAYYKVDDFTISQSYQSPDKLEMIYQSINIDYSSAFTTSIILPVNIGKLFSTRLIGNIYNEHYKNSSWQNLIYNRKKWAYSAMANNTLKVSQKPEISIDVNLFYNSSTIQGIWDLSDRWGVDAGVKCALAKGKAILSFQCDDIFESKYPTIKIRHNTQCQDINSNFYNRTFYVTLTYKFNGYKEKRTRTVDTSRFGTK